MSNLFLLLIRLKNSAAKKLSLDDKTKSIINHIFCLSIEIFEEIFHGFLLFVNISIGNKNPLKTLYLKGVGALDAILQIMLYR